VIKLNTVGYVTGRNKFATVPADAPDSAFVIRNLANQEVAFQGALPSTVINDVDTGDAVRSADFSSFDEPGNFVLEVGSYATSPSFEIGETVYNNILQTSLLGLYGQRCGVALQFDYVGDTFSHAICHQNDALFDPNLVPGQSGQLDATGGWHDAGDYGKYTVNGAFSAAFLLKAWEDFGQPLGNVNHIPEYTDSLPSILAEAKVELDWLLKMQSPDGTVLDLICPKSYPGDSVMPEADSPPRYFLPAAAADTSYFAAVAAMASRVFLPFDNTYANTLLAAAQNAMAWLAINSADVPVKDGTSNARLLAGGPYAVSAAADSPPRVWAAVELWRTSGEGDLTAIETDLRAMAVASNWDWPTPGNLALFDYAASDSILRDAATVTKIQGAITTVADGLVATAQSYGYGRALGAGTYYWGSNGLVARTAMTLQAAFRITSDSKYLDAATQQVDYLLGRNPFGRSMVTGLGYAPPAFPHHRPSNGDRVDEPWPGLLVGGPNQDDPMAPKDVPVPPGKSWFDQSEDYYTNEIAINWNAALVYAVAGFVK
jgi:endoglucanase